MTRELLFLMNAEQAQEFARLLGAAERGDGAAACRLGDMYRVGEGGLRYSPAETFRWYAKSALTGDANGQCNLGACYEHGLGCVQSYAKAVKWYRLSVAQGLATAAMNLGYCTLRGHGLPRDEVEALRLFRLAVEGGEDRAAQEVERLEMSRGPRGLQLAPEDTAQVPRRSAVLLRCGPASASVHWRSSHATHPCSLAVGVLPPDGPREQLQPSETWSAEDVINARPVITHEVDEPGAITSTTVQNVKDEPDRSKVRVIRGIRFVDETRPGKHLGLVGVGGVEPLRPPPWEDEDVRRALLEVLKFGAAEADVDENPGTCEAADADLFPIYAECGMVPGDFVPETAKRYARYLGEHKQVPE